MDIFDITASALTAQRLRLDTIASNLANVNTTHKEDGSVGAYRRKNVVFGPVLDAASQRFKSGGTGLANSISMRPSSSGMSIGANGEPVFKLHASRNSFSGTGVEVLQITQDSDTPMRMVYDPTHPDSNGDGYVEMPNVNPVTEMVDMISATRAYEANVTALQSAKSMMQAALEI